MSDSNESLPNQWRNIIGLYAAFCTCDASHQPMLELARWLANSPYSDQIIASTSLDRLNLWAPKFSRLDQWQGAQISRWRDEFCVEFHRYEAGGGYIRWSRDYTADELRAAMEAWLWRLELENAS